jgi:hypothetical protein
MSKGLSDAEKFILAAGITDATQKTAITTLVDNLKSYGIWSKMKALYPMVGGTAASHKFNLKDPRDLNAAFRLTFSGGWTHSSTGALPNGTNAYADSFLNPSINILINQGSLGYYSRTNNVPATTMAEMGAITYTPFPNYFFQIHARLTNNAWLCNPNTADAIFSQITTNSSGFYQGTRLNATNYRQIRNIITGDAVRNYATPNLNVYIGARSLNGLANAYSNRECAFAYMGNSLSTTEASNFYTAVQAYQTSLSRQV